MGKLNIGRRWIADDRPSYFIADIAANHDGNLERAKMLICLAAQAGADAIKMQNFTVETIVSDFGFRHLAGVQTHQSKWKQSVFESYQAASIPLEWTLELKALSGALGLHYLTSPYSPELVRAVAPHVDAFKLGSGDLTWHEELAEMCGFGKAVLIATGASTMAEVAAAMAVALALTRQVLLMQCNTDYTSNIHETREQRRQRFRNINLRVLQTFAQQWPGIPLGLSDHTQGSLTVLGAVGLFDCCAVEKHFTLDNSIEGQDHAFSMTPAEWRRMADATAALKRALEGVESWDERVKITGAAVDDPEALRLAIGDGVKRLEPNESGTVIVQRRAIRAARELSSGQTLTRADLAVLRPCPADALPPYRIGELLARRLVRPLQAGDCVRVTDVA